MNTNHTDIIPLHQYAEKAYLDYSMYVILDRALPHIADGLKPVQRRIIYAMSELGLKAATKFKKSARTIGDVLGKYHPHSDVACYEALVLMAQPFVYRYPLIQGQGNFGSPDDPKSFAAMRYTESRLSLYADCLLAELGAGTVDWVPNFDGTLHEPALLPASVPNILLNGTTGIAVGMATDIPPHNLSEVTQALIHLLNHPHATLEEIHEFIPGPDYPTAAEIITSKQDIQQIYRSGNGSIRIRATYTIKHDEIIITALPYQVSGSKILEQIAQQMQEKKLPFIIDLRDESDHEHPTRLVLVLRSNRVNAEEIMHHLFATTELERSYRINFNMIGLNGRPQVKNLLQILNEWLEYRTQIVTRRLTHRLDAINYRLHILEGLIIVYLNLDEVIHIIRHEDQPQLLLIKKFKLSQEQVDVILDTKLRHLTRLEEIQIRKEQEALNLECEDITQTLNSKTQLKKLIRKELEERIKRHPDKRCSPLITRKAAQSIQDTITLSIEPITLILSEKGWVRVSKSQEINPTQLSYKTGDRPLIALTGFSNQHAIFLDTTGRAYSLPTHTLPSARGQGEPLTSRLSPPSGAQFIAAILDNPDTYYVLASNAGYGFIVKLNELYAKNKGGKTILSLPTRSLPLLPKRINHIDTDYLAVLTKLGHLLVFSLNELPQLEKGKGNKLIQFSKSKKQTPEDCVIDLAILHAKQSLILVSEKKRFTLTYHDWEYYKGKRAQSGRMLPKTHRHIISMKAE